MPKMKTNKGAAKRFKITGTGKIMRRNVGLNHILQKKSEKRKRHLGKARQLAPGDARQVKKLLGL